MLLCQVALQKKCHTLQYLTQFDINFLWVRNTWRSWNKFVSYFEINIVILVHTKARNELEQAWITENALERAGTNWNKLGSPGTSWNKMELTWISTWSFKKNIYSLILPKKQKNRKRAVQQVVNIQFLFSIRLFIIIFFLNFPHAASMYHTKKFCETDKRASLLGIWDFEWTTR